MHTRSECTIVRGTTRPFFSQPSSLSLPFSIQQATIAALAARARSLEAQLDTERLARAAAEAAVAASRKEVPADEAEWEALESAAASFKAGRDKAVSALASAHDDLDRTVAEMETLTKALDTARASARAWEGAAAEATARADRLADLLAEGSGSDPASLDAALARCARLEASVAALAIEVGRAGRLTDGVASAVLPALAAVEERLGGVAFPKAGMAPGRAR